MIVEIAGFFTFICGDYFLGINLVALFCDLYCSLARVVYERLYGTITSEVRTESLVLCVLL